ncbi:MAG TPA: response regulator transcription factor, partial [Candidatus Nanopelagicales bacterium]|nr:response regulator transcription factor [Candidatus Nanopelagicales bacterium]
MRILVADDDEMARRMLDLLIDDAGYDVVLAYDGLEAVAVAEGQDPPPVLLLDWMMPGLTGIEVCRRLRGRAGAGLSSAPYILLVTGRGLRQDTLEGFDAGADELLVKPYAPEVLIAQVRIAERVITADAPPSGPALDALAEALRGPGGAVEVDSGVAKGCVLVREGRVAWAHVSTDPSALHALLGPDAGLSDERLRSALEACQRSGQRFDDVILAWGLAEQARRRERLRAWITRKLDAILRLPEPTVRLVAEAQGAQDARGARDAAPGPTFPPDEVL